MTTDLEYEVRRQLDQAIDRVLDVIEEASAAEVEIDPLETILRRVKERGHTLNMDEMPPLMKMILGGMGQ